MLTGQVFAGKRTALKPCKYERSKHLEEAIILCVHDSLRVSCFLDIKGQLSPPPLRLIDLRFWQVDATILEVGAGGAYSTTSVLPKPIVTAVTALGIDHVDLLGGTLGSITWHKAGIFQVCH